MDDASDYMMHEDSDGYDNEEDDNDNAPYDDELEEDQGDAEDIADEMEEMEARRRQAEEDRRYDEFEIMADAAALQEKDVVGPIDPSTANLTVLQVSKKGKGSSRGRSATKGLRVSEPMHITFDDLCRPKGKWRLKFGQQVGFCMRKCNINWNWKDVSDGTRKLMWQDTMNLFHIPDEKKLKKKFLSRVAKRFRDFKSKLVSGWITKTRPRSKFEDGRQPPEIWKHIRAEDWKLFQQIKTSSVAKKKRDKAVECAKKNDHYHHLGQNDFNTARPIWIKDGFYPRSEPTSEETSINTVDVNRADDWFCAMHSKDKETGLYVIKKPKTKEVAEKYLEIREKQARGEFIPERNRDALYFALGEKEDHPSRARGFGGVNITVRQAFGAAIRISGSSTSSEDREALKNELKEELRNEMKLEVRSNMSSILQQMGLPLRDGDVATDTCPPRAQMNHKEKSLPPVIKDDTPCRLLLKDPHNGVIYEVARGKIFPGEVCHQTPIASDQIRVKVSIVPEEFQTLPLPVPVPAYDCYVLSDSVGAFVQWPIALVRFENEGERPEVMGSNSHHSKLSVTPSKTPTQEFIVESLSPDCQWLKELVGTMNDEETYNIYLDANLFYYNEDGNTEVNKCDLKNFLERSELNIPIFQIFIRGLRDDLKKVDTTPRIGWLCPDSTSDTKLIKKVEVAISYVTNAFQKSSVNGEEFILAPIIDSKHWVLLVICPQTYTIYEFDSISLQEGRKLYMRMVVLSALKRYKMSGGWMKVTRKEPLWKSMKCPQQSGSMEDGYFVMRFMYDIVKNCTTTIDLEKVWNSQREEPYTDCEINEVRDKWAAYFTSRIS